LTHYLAILVPQAGAGWRAHFPDFPGCRAEANTIDAAIEAATAAVRAKATWYRDQGVSLPRPQTYEEVRHQSNGWATDRGIVWSRAVMSVVKLTIE
jgi:predicted RNase H-like HicB family nuclease